MGNEIRFEIITKDRLGITVEILEKIYEAKINLISVEVFSKKVCVKIENINDEKKEALKNNLYNINEVVHINEIELLRYEENERKLMAIIDSVDDGIMVINKDFKVDIFNNYCEKVFNCNKEEIIGTDIRELIGQDAPAVDLINNGIKYDNVEVYLNNDRGESHYITTGRPIINDNNKTIGAVASIKDIHKAIEMANVVSATKEGAFQGIVGNSIAMERVKRMATAVAKSDSTILLRGESGTGKELFAKAIQHLSHRNNKKFVTINCAALPDNLIESELFGYEKGSFTGAINSGKDGLFKEAHGGTLFLDEIGELSMSLQAKLLRVIQEGVIRKIGSTKEEKIDVRIIAATNRNLEDMIDNNQFREDLYYRLNVIPIEIPTLRERIEDIPSLVTVFIDNFNKKLKKNVKGAEAEFINQLLQYSWPGNVRELQNVIERAMNLCEGSILKAENLIIDIRDKRKNVRVQMSIDKELKLNEVVEICEKEAIIKALDKYKSYRKVAKVLGVSHTTVINKMKKYNMIRLQ